MESDPNVMAAPLSECVDLQDALLRVEDEQLLLELLEEFAASWGDGATRVEAALIEKGPAKAAAVAHALAGVAATLSVRGVWEAARSIEGLSGTDAAAFAASLERLRHELARFVSAIDHARKAD